MWRQRDFEDLLRRVEMDILRNQRAGGNSRRKKPADNGEERTIDSVKAEAIHRMVQEGAYRKASMAILDEGLPIPKGESRMWAETLRPAHEGGCPLVTGNERQLWSDAKAGEGNTRGRTRHRDRPDDGGNGVLPPAPEGNTGEGEEQAQTGGAQGNSRASHDGFRQPPCRASGSAL